MIASVAYAPGPITSENDEASAPMDRGAASPGEPGGAVGGTAVGGAAVAVGPEGVAVAWPSAGVAVGAALVAVGSSGPPPPAPAPLEPMLPIWGGAKPVPVLAFDGVAVARTVCCPPPAGVAVADWGAPPAPALACWSAPSTSVVRAGPRPPEARAGGAVVGDGVRVASAPGAGVSGLGTPLTFIVTCEVEISPRPPCCSWLRSIR